MHKVECSGGSVWEHLWHLRYRYHTAVRTLAWWRPVCVPERWEYEWFCALDLVLERVDPGDDGSDFIARVCAAWQAEVRQRQRWPDRVAVARAQIVRRERERAEFWGGSIEHAWLAGD
jgi:hypothetical protein